MMTAVVTWFMVIFMGALGIGFAACAFLMALAVITNFRKDREMVIICGTLAMVAVIFAVGAGYAAFGFYRCL